MQLGRAARSAISASSPSTGVGDRAGLGRRQVIDFDRRQLFRQQRRESGHAEINAMGHHQTLVRPRMSFEIGPWTDGDDRTI
jgi:hypothetical protein